MTPLAAAGVRAKAGLDRILESRRIQGFDDTVLRAVVGTVDHFAGHAHQIVYITRLWLGDAHRFDWVPQSPEQKSAKAP